MEENNPNQDNQEEKLVEETEAKNQLKFTFYRFFISMVSYFKTVVNIREDVDFEGSVNSIKKDIDFKGVNVWILGASIVVASIGLNVNSAAVVIGAMLISPLMGPIVGAGFAIGVNDFQLLTRSIRSLGTAVLISVIVSTIYFLITPFGDVQSELIARTRPNLLDVMVAFFGGIALIVAKTQRGTVASVIFGVAIATALMPPLCTAGYGLANGNWSFFFGAFYLFTINSVFIALSTFLITKYLKFPLATYIDPERQKKVRWYILGISLLVILPSSFTFWSTIQESLFNRNANQFITENFKLEGTEVINVKLDYNSSEQSKIEVFVIGELISKKTEQELANRLSNYELNNVDFKIHQTRDNTNEIAGQLSAQVKSGIIEELYSLNASQLKDKDEKIAFLQNQLVTLRGKSIPFNSIQKELKAQYSELEKMSYGLTYNSDFSEKIDTIPMFYVTWSDKSNKKEAEANREKIEAWLKVRLENKKVEVKNLQNEN